MYVIFYSKKNYMGILECTHIHKYSYSLAIPCSDFAGAGKQGANSLIACQPS